MWKVSGKNISQSFNNRLIFKELSFSVGSGSSLVLTGPNGSGKTTLIRIICQLIRPKSGEITFERDGKFITGDGIFPNLGLVSPYLQLYNDLTALENYTFFARIRGLGIHHAEFKELMRQLGLRGRELDQLKTYSSGMLQRIKYVMALIHHPAVLLLDEPTANLDEAGVEVVYRIMEEQKKNKILILATNEPEETRFGENQIKLNT